MENGKQLDAGKFGGQTTFNIHEAMQFKRLQRDVNKEIPKSNAREVLMARVWDRYSPPIQQVKIPTKSKMTDAEIYQAIISATIEVSGEGCEKIFSKSRKVAYITPRQIVIFLIRVLTDYTLKQIGELLKCDHSTVIHQSTGAYFKIQMKDKRIYTMYQRILQILEGTYKLVPNLEKTWCTNLRDGIKIYSGKLTHKEIKEIRKLSESIAKAAIARMYGVSETTIMRILSKKK